LIKGLGGRMFAGRGTFAFPWRNRRRRRRADTGSMPLAMLVTLVGVTLSAGVSGLVVGQIKSSQLAANRVAAVAAAQAGLDAQLAAIRSAVDANGGVLAQLPCASTTATTLTSLGGATTTTPTYQGSIGYFLVDPTDMVNSLRSIGDLSNINQLVAGTTTVTSLLGTLGQTATTTLTTALDTAVQSALDCVGGLKQVPLYGLLRSVGKVGSVTRVLYATYTFHTTEETIAGGHIVISGTNGQLCLGASDPTSVVNNAVVALPCTAGDNLIKFIYPKNLSLSLAASRTAKTAGLPYGLCVTGPAVPANGAPITMTACAASKIPTQQWQYEVNQQTYYSTTNGSTSNNYCLSMQTPGLSGSPIVLKAGVGICGNAGNAGRAFVPDPFVGPGGAGVNSGQLVNFQEVGRCLDLTNEDPKGVWFTSRGLSPALITYPCKQTFTGSVYWNHKWSGPAIPLGTYKATGTVSTIPTNGSYINQEWCMQSPGLTGGYVWVALCSAGGVDLQWTVYDAAPLSSEAYQIVDAYGNCLEAAGARGAAYQYSGYSEVITAACDGSGVQKWNKPRGMGLSPLTGVQER
jgi:hypothetical protein